MYQDIYNCLCQNTKNRYIIHYAQLLFKIRFPKGGPTCRRQMVNPRHQTPQGQSVAKPKTTLQNIQIARCDIKDVFVCLCLYHYVSPDDKTMKDSCHTNNILQVHCWGRLVVQAMFHALMTSPMTSPGHTVGQILKLIYLRQYLSSSVDQRLKISEMLVAVFLLYSASCITSAEKKNCRELKMAAIFKILKY